MIVTRFAPSPTGDLHLGHAACALFAFRKAQESGGRFLLRIEDIDPVRCKPDYVQGIYDDLRWLGLSWPEPVRLQSHHGQDYQKALEVLRGKGLLYPCFCTRKEIEREIGLSASAPHQTEEGPVYPQTCRNLPQDVRADLLQTRQAVWRLDMEKAAALAGPLFWRDAACGQEVRARPERFGDIVLARKDIPTSYHLSVTVDDALQGVTLVTRGEDLRGVTDIHRLLQALLGLPVPTYWHHPLVRDSAGRRLAKRDRAVTLSSLRREGRSQQEVVSVAVSCF